jgi:hypothetical protein
MIAMALNYAIFLGLAAATVGVVCLIAMTVSIIRDIYENW